jgi:hypothetical protein
MVTPPMPFVPTRFVVIAAVVTAARDVSAVVWIPTSAASEVAAVISAVVVADLNAESVRSDIDAEAVCFGRADRCE